MSPIDIFGFLLFGVPLLIIIWGIALGAVRTLWKDIFGG